MYVCICALLKGSHDLAASRASDPRPRASAAGAGARVAAPRRLGDGLGDFLELPKSSLHLYLKAFVSKKGFGFV